jgi:YVTN family beta-propeller protein
MVLGAALAGVLVVGAASAAVGGFNPFGSHQVGQSVKGATLLPTNQWISPLGNRILDNNARLVSSTLSPNGIDVAALGWNDFSGFVTIVNVKTGKIDQQLALKTGPPGNPDTSVAADGPLYSPDGKTLWVPQTTYLDRFTVNADGTVSSTPTATIPLCGSDAATSSNCTVSPSTGGIGPKDGPWLPSGMALSPDGSKLYLTLNGANTLGVVDTSTNKLTKQIPVGNAPRQIVLAGNGTTAYISNEGGRPAESGDFTNISDGTPIVSNRSTGAAVTGTVSVVNLSTGKETQEIPVGLQPTALYQNGNALLVANSNDDSLSVINEATNRVAQTVRTNPVPGAKVGSYANAISMPDAHHVLVSIGRDNAVAVYKYRGLSRPLRYQGLIPTDWYPVQVQPDKALGAKRIVVTNDKGIGARGPASTINLSRTGAPTASNPGDATGHNTYDDTGSVTTFALPGDNQLASLTKKVFVNNAWNQLGPINAGKGDSASSVVPQKIGEKSPIKHVMVLVKENRTYDQVLGDLGEGNGDPSDAQFGKSITPNLHALARRFGDFDNFYDEGTLSADGHNWIVQAEANDYVEKEFGAFYRSYPAQGGDALAYQRDGFLWNAAQKAGRNVAAFGEYANFFNVPTSADKWADWYKDSQILEGKASGPLPIPVKKYKTYSDIPSLNSILDPYYPKFDTNVPDQYRVDMWLKAWKKYQRSGHFPNLSLLWVPDDHTAGVGSGDPAPIAQVADNDLAVGRIIDKVSHSKWWKSTAIFVLEDDPQNGVDHVDGHRSVLWVASPYSARGGVNDNYYSQINVVRTIEQLLGIHPMNQEDKDAVPMYSAFTNKPNFAPFNVKRNQVPLTLGAPGFPSTEANMAREKANVPSSERKVFEAWEAWSRHQRFNGGNAIEDYAKPALLNRLDWYSAHGWNRAYPGDARIYLPSQVPGRNLPAEDLDG